jgi:TolB-like protein
VAGRGSPLGWIAELRRRPASPGAYLARRQRRRFLALAGAVLLVVLAAWGAVLHFQRPGRDRFHGEPAIAVLPFANLDRNRDDDYFADGMTAEIQAALAQIPGLRVIGRTTSLALGARAGGARDAARKLGVTAILEGSVRRSGSRLRVNAQIVDPRDGFQLWSETYERSAADALAVQDEIGHAVAHALEVRLLPRRAPSAGGRPVHPEAYSQYLLAKRLLAQSDLDGSVRAAAASERSIDLAPGFAPAWVTLAIARMGIADWLEAPDEIVSNRRAASAAVDRALALDPELAWGYATRALFEAESEWDWDEAGADFDRALALAPGDADVLRQKAAWFLAPQGRLSEAIDLARRSTELDPLSPRGWTTLGYLQVAASAGVEGEGPLRRALEIDPDYEYARQARGVRQLLVGNPSAALAEARRCAPGMWRLRGEAVAEHSLGNVAGSDAALAAFVAEFAIPSPYQVAEIHAWRGEADLAIAWLEKAIAARDGGLTIFAWDPLLGPVRNDPRMASIRRRLRLDAD